MIFCECFVLTLKLYQINFDFPPMVTVLCISIIITSNKNNKKELSSWELFRLNKN